MLVITEISWSKKLKVTSNKGKLNIYAVVTTKIVELQNSQSLKILIMLYKCTNPVYTIINVLWNGRREGRKGARLTTATLTAKLKLRE